MTTSQTQIIRFPFHGLQTVFTYAKQGGNKRGFPTVMNIRKCTDYISSCQQRIIKVLLVMFGHKFDGLALAKIVPEADRSLNQLTRPASRRSITWRNVQLGESYVQHFSRPYIRRQGSMLRNLLSQLTVPTSYGPIPPIRQDRASGSTRSHVLAESGATAGELATFDMPVINTRLNALLAAVVLATTTALITGGGAYALGHRMAKAQGDEALLTLQREQAMAAKAANEARLRLVAEIKRNRYLAQQLADTKAAHTQEKQSLLWRIANVYIPAAGLASEPLPRTVFTAGMSEYNAALGLSAADIAAPARTGPSPEVATAPEAWLRDAGLSQADIPPTTASDAATSIR